MLAADTSAVAALALNAPPSKRNALAWKQLSAPVEPFLQAVSRKLTQQIQEFEPDIASYAEYALTAQGKQLRPVLVALSAGAAGEPNDSHVLAAVIIEMVHLATLVHDDVMDEAKLRRGRPTLAANWGNEISVLLGDCLFAHALKLAAGFPTTEICRAVSAATNTVCSGEILQTQRRKNFELTREEYFKVVTMKTGELFALSCDLGAYLSRANNRDRAALKQFGLAIGTAYQVYDDCLDLFGSEAKAGKSLGTDLAKGKLTLPMIIAMERATVAERAEFQTTVQDWQAENFGRVVKWLSKHQALGASQQTVHEYLLAAREAIRSLRESESRAGLFGLADYLAQQTDALAHHEIGI